MNNEIANNEIEELVAMRKILREDDAFMDKEELYNFMRDTGMTAKEMLENANENDNKEIRK